MPSQTNVTTETLRTLHRIHQQLSDLNARLRHGPNLVRAHEENVERQLGELVRLQDEAKAIRLTADKKQGQLKDSEAKVEKFRQQLNHAESNREYQTLKDQIAATEMANSVLADEILEALEKIDELAEKLTRAEAAADTTRKEAEKVKQEVQEREPTIHADIRRLEAELEECEASLPGDFRQLYKRVVRARGEDALAPVQGEYCGGCNQHVPINMVNELMLSKPIFCKACGRLLYIPEDRSGTE